MKNSVFKYIINAKERFPKKTAIVMGEETVTYDDLYWKAISIATWINARLNDTRKPVFVMMKNSPKSIVAFMGITASNNIYVPLAYDLPIERLRTILKVCQPSLVIVCDGDAEEMKSTFDCEVIRFEDAIGVPNEPVVKQLVLETIDTDPLYILFTSGSTGIPKGVILPHRAIFDFTEEASEEMGFDNNEAFLNQAPFYFDASVPDIYCTIRNAATLHIVEKSFFSFPIKLLKYIEAYHISSIFWVPSALVLVANLKALGKADISSLKNVMFCGEVMPTKQLNMWREILPTAKYVNYYGPCETTYASTYYVIDREFNNDELLPIGKAAINTRILLVSEGKQVDGANKKGEIYIAGTGLALGYYNDPEKTRASFVQNPTHDMYPDIVYKTGDIAHYNDFGEIVYDGRADFQIKHMGYRIELGEIECAVNALDNIQQVACVYSKEHDIIACFYTGKVDKEDVRSYLISKIPIYMQPKRIEQLRAMPMNQNGKIDRIALGGMLC